MNQQLAQEPSVHHAQIELYQYRRINTGGRRTVTSVTVAKALGASRGMSHPASNTKTLKFWLYSLIKVEVGFDDALLVVAAQVEAERFEEALHRAVIKEYIGGDAMQALCAVDLEEPLEEDGAEALTLEAVANEDGEFGLAWDGMLPAQAYYSQDLTLPGLGVPA